MNYCELAFLSILCLDDVANALLIFIDTGWGQEIKTLYQKLFKKLSLKQPSKFFYVDPLAPVWSSTIFEEKGGVCKLHV